jgi:formate transporter
MDTREDKEVPMEAMNRTPAKVAERDGREPAGELNVTAPSFAADAYSPSEVARKVETVGVAKAQMALLPLAMLGVLAGAFIGLGSMLFVIVRADASLGLAASQLVAGLAFSLGLLLVVVAGAELFTGNNLLAMAWADGKVTSMDVLRNWVVVCAANFAGAAGLALFVYLSGHTAMGSGAIGRTVVRIALAKQDLPLQEAFFRAVLCNVLVCMAVWMAMAGRSVTDKAVAVVFPIMAFVAAGFEHSIANMYLMPLAMLVQAGAIAEAAQPAVTLAGMGANLAVVIAGNLLGGSVLVGLTYHVIYRRSGTPHSSAAASEAHVTHGADAPRP